MTDAGQQDLSSWSDSAGEERPEAEAEHVAGTDGGAAGDVVDPAVETLPDADGTVEIRVMQVDYTIEGTGSDETPIVHVFGRTEDGEREHVRVRGFQPYFYVPADSVDPSAFATYDGISGYEAGYESIRGDELLKVFGRTPRDVGQVRDEFEHYEADVLFPNRFLIDKGVQSGIRVPVRREDGDGADVAGTDAPGERAANAPITVHHEEVEPVDVLAEPRVHTLDIEVDDRRGFPEDGEEPIVCLSTHDSVRDEYVGWVYAGEDATWSGEPDDLEYDPITDDAAVEVRTFEDEAAMLASYLQYVEDTDPDVLTGWNFDDFDMPYLLDRLEMLDGRLDVDADLSIERLSRVDEVWRSNWGAPDVKGRVVFDLLYAYQRTQFSELDSYRLDAVAEEELGVGKERYTGDLGDLWEQEPERLLEYNLRDVELCVELDRKQDVIAFWDEVRTFVGCKLEDATTPGDAVDMYVLHKVNGEFVLPSKGQQESEDYEGGAVFDPITGVREMVSVLDLKSLYPMCMVTTNASPETKVDSAEYDGETYVAPNGTHFRKEPDGIIREMVDELLGERDEKKSLRDDNDPGTADYERYDRQQQAVKVIMNSLYGVLGWERFRLYDKEMGAAVTATGREVIEFTEEAANEIGHEVVYGDSVTGDRPIVVRDHSGIVRIEPIEELYEAADARDAGDALITADGGPVRSVTVGKERATLDGWEALSLSPEGEAEWQPINQVIRHQTDEDVVKLQHKFGESTTTEDHSFIVEDDGEYVETTPREVEEPLRIPNFPEVDVVKSIDVYEVLDGYTRQYEDGRSVGSENAETKVKRVHADDEFVWFGHEHHRDQDKTIKVQRYIDAESEDGRALIRLLAAYVTEGSASTIETTDAKFGASIAESDPGWLAGLRSDYQRLFDGAETCVIASDSRNSRSVDYTTQEGKTQATYDDGTQKLQMMNELTAVFFREFAGQMSRGKRIPNFVYHLPEDRQELFLEVLIEGDGSREFPRYSEQYCERNFDFETTSRELAAGLSMLLTQRGRKHSLKYREAKDSYTVRTCDFYRSGRDPVVREVDHDGYVYDLDVGENDNFVDALGGIVLHNTDSVMLELGGDVSVDDAIEQSFAIEEHINGAYDEFAREQLNADEHRFEIEFEKLYRRFFQAGKKKRYAGHIVWKEGKRVDDVDITGFEYQRSDIAPITKEVQLEVIDMIVRGEPIDAVTDYVHDTIQEFKNGNVDPVEVGIPGGIGKRLDNYDTDTAQVRGAKYANAFLGTNFDRGSKPKRLYIEDVDPAWFRHMENERGFNPQEDDLYLQFKREIEEKEGVICIEYADQLPEEFEIDWEKMLEKTLQGPIERILEALDVSWEEVESGQEQTGLSGFM